MSNSAALPVPVQLKEHCSLSGVRRIAAMLDLDPDSVRGEDLLPRGWHFMLLAAATRRSVLRADGFPGLGIAMPDLGLARVMLSSRSVRYHTDLRVGSEYLRLSEVLGVESKNTRSGDVALVTLQHSLMAINATSPALVESQTYVMLPAPRSDSTPKATEVSRVVDVGAALHRKVVVPDETMLFQYSALGFNSHRIHLDREHARSIEGFPDLVVNGGLTALLMTEFLRTELHQTPALTQTRYLAPLYCGRPITLTAERGHGPKDWIIRCLDDRLQVAAHMEVTAS